MGQRPPIIINRLDAERLQRLIDHASEKDQVVAELLEEELSRGEVLDPQDIPDNVVSMNSQIRFTDLTRGCQMVRTLVYPHALASVADGISVMAPIGAALIGLKVGDDVVIGSGAQIIGPIKVGKCARIAANAVVVKDVPDNATMVGIPAKAIKLENEGNFRPYGVDDKVKDE